MKLLPSTQKQKVPFSKQPMGKSTSNFYTDLRNSGLKAVSLIGWLDLYRKDLGQDS